MTADLLAVYVASKTGASVQQSAQCESKIGLERSHASSGNVREGERGRSGNESDRKNRRSESDTMPRRQSARRSTRPK